MGKVQENNFTDYDRTTHHRQKPSDFNQEISRPAGQVSTVQGKVLKANVTPSISQDACNGTSRIHQDSSPL
jgi:hypothetical protein